jgi:hypothetical protein
MLYSNFRETATSEVHLPDETVEQIEEFVAWLYTGQSPFQIEIDKFIKSIVSDTDEKAKDMDEALERESAEGVIHGISLWVMGDKFICPHFTNHIIKYLPRKFDKTYFSSWDTEYAYNNTMTNSKMRLLYKDMIAADGPLRPNSSETLAVSRVSMIDGYFF